MFNSHNPELIDSEVDTWNNNLIQACFDNKPDEIKRIFAYIKSRIFQNSLDDHINVMSVIDIKSIIQHACQHENIEIIKTLMNQSPLFDWQSGLLISSEYGDINTVKLMLEYAENKELLDKSIVSGALLLACEKGFYEIVKFILDNQLIEHNHPISTDLFGNSSLLTNRQGNIRELIQNYMPEIAESRIVADIKNFNWGLEMACKYNNLALINLILIQGENTLNKCLQLACEHEYLDIALLAISRGATNLSQCFYKACEKGSMSVVKFLIHSGVNALHWGLFAALNNYRINLIEYFLFLGVNINYEYISLNEDQISYLVKNNITNLGKYTDIANRIISDNRTIKFILSTQLPSELVSIIINF